MVFSDLARNRLRTKWGLGIVTYLALDLGKSTFWNSKRMHSHPSPWIEKIISGSNQQTLSKGSLCNTAAAMVWSLFPAWSVQLDFSSHRGWHSTRLQCMPKITLLSSYQRAHTLKEGLLQLKDWTPDKIASTVVGRHFEPTRFTPVLLEPGSKSAGLRIPRRRVQILAEVLTIWWRLVGREGTGNWDFSCTSRPLGGRN